ncbi:MAG: VanZ family protein [Thermodesulfobacteriota bacterium]
MRRLLLYWAPLLAYMGLVLYASLNPMPDRLPDYWQMDKLYHFGAYLVMGVLWARALNGGRAGRMGARVFVAAAATTFLFGVFVELCQEYLPYRSAEVIDALVNGGAGVTGALGYARYRPAARLASTLRANGDEGGRR